MTINESNNPVIEINEDVTKDILNEYVYHAISNGASKEKIQEHFLKFITGCFSLYLKHGDYHLLTEEERLHVIESGIRNTSSTPNVI